MAEAFGSGDRNRSTRDQKLLDSGLNNFESILKDEEKAYSVSLARRRKLFEKHKLAEKKAILTAAADEYNAFEKAERNKHRKALELEKASYEAKLKMAAGDAEKRRKIEEDHSNEVKRLEEDLTATLIKGKDKLIQKENEYHESVILAESELANIRKIYNENLAKSLPVLERLTLATEMASDAEKGYLESKWVLEDAIAKTSEESIQTQLEGIRAQKAEYESLVNTIKSKMDGLSPDTDEWIKLNDQLESYSIQIAALGETTSETLLAGAMEAVTKATEEAESAQSEWISKLEDRVKVMRSASEYRAKASTASASPNLAAGHTSTLGAEAYIGNVQKDISDTLTSMEQLISKQAELTANGDVDAANRLGDVIENMRALVKDQQESIKLTTKDADGKTVLTELGKLLKDQEKEKKTKDREDRKSAAKDRAAMNRGDSAIDSIKEAFDEASTRMAEKMVDKADASKEAAAEKNSEIAANIENAMRSALNDLSQSIDNDINSFFEYQSALEGRLQGSGESYEKMLQVIATKININPYISQKEVVNNIKTLIESGVSYNVELRSFLQTVSEDIAATFDAFDKNLLRIVRIQQADSTAARLGMEATLTKLFNSQYQDTSYLADSVSDSVSGAILEASSMLSHQNSLEFEYAVQKWLGSMYSVGVSDTTVNRIAQGLNYLGTGNVEALSGDESMQTLLAMAASRAGVPYADVLTNGLGAEDTNKILRSMTEYLLEIAKNTDNNQVTKSAYSNLFGISMSDLSAITNLYDENYATLESLSKSSLTMAQAEDEVMNQINLISSRVHASQFIDTLVENIAATTAVGIGSSGVMYGMWKALNIVDALTGGIYIPGITVMGYGITSEINVLDLAKAGMAGLGFLGALVGGLSQGASIGGVSDLSSWGYDKTTRRGSGRTALTSGVSQGFSQKEEIMGVGSGSGDDIKNTSKEQAANEAGTSSEEQQEEQDAAKKNSEDTLKALDNGETTVVTEISKLNSELMPGVNTLLASIVGLLDTNRIFKTDGSGAMTTIQELLSPNRVFYSVNPVEISGATSNSLKYNSSNSMLMYDVNGTYASNIESATDMVMGSSLLTAIYSMAGVTPASLSSVSIGGSSTASSSEMATSISEVKDDVSTMSTAITALYSDIITNKSPISVSSTQSENMKVSIGDISNVRAPLVEALKEAMTSSFGATVGGGEESTTFAEAIADALSSVTMPVEVKNDYFDTFLQTKAMDV